MQDFLQQQYDLLSPIDQVLQRYNNNSSNNNINNIMYTHIFSNIYLHLFRRCFFMFYHVILERVRVPKIASLNEARCVGAFGCLDLIDPKTGEPLGDLWWLSSE